MVSRLMKATPYKDACPFGSGGGRFKIERRDFNIEG